MAGGVSDAMFELLIATSSEVTIVGVDVENAKEYKIGELAAILLLMPRRRL